MSLHYIIDGYNIINHPYFIRAVKTSREPQLSLLAFIRTQRLTGSVKNKATVVFDGYSAPSLSGYNETGIDIIFSRKISADEKIKMLIEESSQRKIILVVSDDKDIKLFTKFLGARSVGVEEFINRKKTENLKKDLLKPELTYSQTEQINRELKKIWLSNQ